MNLVEGASSSSYSSFSFSLVGHTKGSLLVNNQLVLGVRDNNAMELSSKHVC